MTAHRLLVSVLLFGAMAQPRLLAAPERAAQAANIEHLGNLPGKGTYICRVGTALFLTPANAKAQATAPGTWFNIGANPAAPVAVNAALPSAWDVVVDGDYAVACDYRKFLTVYNLKEHQWREVTTLTLPAEAENVVRRGQLVYVATHNAGLTIVDIATPEKPVIVSHLNPKIDCDAVALWQNCAILYGHWQSRIVVADIRDPAQPRPTGVCQLPPKIFNGGELEVAHGFAYATTTNGLAIVNVTDPAQPQLVKLVNVGAVASDVVVQDQFAFVAAAGRGVRVLDVTHPAEPVEVGFYQAPGRFHATAIAVQKVAGTVGDYHVYVAGGGAPAAVLRFHGAGAR